ncbi:hypothetical protein H4R35_000009 [Dimargaris xerosporica]|nr:hypothetical protein H4R35_000009 [Dimargaris xerosporica]
MASHASASDDYAPRPSEDPKDKHAPTLGPYDHDTSSDDLDPVEYQRFIRKLDWHLVPFFGLLYLFCTLDRINIGNARLFTLEEDMNLSPAQYSWGLSIFFVGYILFEVPSNLALRKFGPARWLARIGVLWGGLSMCQAAVTNFAGFFILRFLFGMSEAGLFPGIIYYLTHWYTRKEISVRIAFFYVSAALAGCIGGLLAYAIGHMDHVGNLRAWQWLFILEGIPSVLLGVVTWFYIPNSPSEASWLSPRERRYAVTRMAQDYTDVEDDRFQWSQFKSAIFDYKVPFYMIMFLGFLNPLYAMSLFQPSVIRDLGFSSWQAQLLTIPPSVINAVITVLMSWHSTRSRERAYHVALPAVVGATGYVLIAFLTGGTARYAVICTLLSMYNASLPPTLGWLTNNLVGSTKAATATAIVVAFGNLSGFISGQFYRPDEAPRYVRSHMINMGFLLAVAISAITLRFLLQRDNRRIDRLMAQKQALLDEVANADLEPVPPASSIAPSTLLEGNPSLAEIDRQLPESVLKYPNFRYQL